MLFTGWNFMRLLRLFIAVYLFYFAFTEHEVFAWALGGLFLLQALTNTGCCAANSCATPTKTSSKNKSSEVVFEEIK